MEVISEQNFTMLSTKLQGEQQALNEENELFKERLVEQEQDTEGISNFIEIIKSLKKIEKLDAKILKALIEKIEIGEKTKDENGEIFQAIDITYKFIGRVEL